MEVIQVNHIPVPTVLTNEAARKIIKIINGRKVAEIPEGVEEIAEECFKDTGVEEVRIPVSVWIIRGSVVDWNEYKWVKYGAF